MFIESILGNFDDLHIWRQNWCQYLWTSLCQLNFFMNLLHSVGVSFFDIWHLFDNLTSFWQLDIFLIFWHIQLKPPQPAQGYFLNWNINFFFYPHWQNSIFLTDCHHFHIEKKSKNDKSLKACNFLNNAPIFNPEKVLESSWSPLSDGGVYKAVVSIRRTLLHISFHVISDEISWCP